MESCWGRVPPIRILRRQVSQNVLPYMIRGQQAVCAKCSIGVSNVTEVDGHRGKTGWVGVSERGGHFWVGSGWASRYASLGGG